MWRELIGECDPAATCAPAATEEELTELESMLDVKLPEDLRTLLAETNGVVGEYGPHYIWATQEIAGTNTEMRNNASSREGWMSFDALLFFANAGVDGILFALPIYHGHIPSPSRVYAWYPIGDNRLCVATSLRDYLVCWLTGRLSV